MITILYITTKSSTVIDIWSTICYNIITVRKATYELQGKLRKEKNMEGMTNEQFNTILKMIIQIIKDSKDKDEAIKKIETLLK